MLNFATSQFAVSFHVIYEYTAPRLHALAINSIAETGTRT